MEDIGKTLILLGSILLLAGIGFLFFDKIPLLGKLPGDFRFEKGNLRVYFPLATSLILSILLSLLFWLIGYLRR